MDYHSATWGELDLLLKRQLAEAREKNDNIALTAEETSALRGRINYIKELLALPRTSETLARIAEPALTDPDY